MKKEWASMASTTLLFIGVAAVTLFIWHSWYLYCGAVLTGYVALMLLTVILQYNKAIEFHYLEQFIRDKTRFYSIVAICFGAAFLFNVFLLALVSDLMNLRGIMMLVDFAVAMIIFAITLYWCERGDWRIWFIKALFG